MANFPQHLGHIEGQIINRVITGALKACYTVSVYDGEEWALNRSTDRAEIQAETAASDETTYVMHDVDGAQVGYVWFIHGNEWDVLVDYTDSAAMNTILANANAFAQAG